jgi:hypothetical protein
VIVREQSHWAGQFKQLMTAAQPVVATATVVYMEAAAFAANSAGTHHYHSAALPQQALPAAIVTMSLAQGGSWHGCMWGCRGHIFLHSINKCHVSVQ